MDSLFIDPYFNETETKIIKEEISKGNPVESYTHYDPDQPANGYVYRTDKSPDKLNINLHFGQRKLCMTEINILTTILNKYNLVDKKITILVENRAFFYVSI